MDDLEKLLGETTETETQTAAPAEEQTTTTTEGSAPEKKTSSDVGKATEGLRKQLVEERKSRQALEAEVARLTAAVKPFEQLTKPAEKASEPDLNSTEGWTKEIDRRAAQAIEPAQKELNSFKEAQKSKALKAFVKEHPEYSLSKGKEKLTGLLEQYNRVKSRGDMDADDISEDLKDAWALQNRSDLEERARRVREESYEAESTAADIASSGSSNYEKSSSPDVDATPLQRKVAAEMGMNIKDYIAYQAKLR